MKPCKIAVLGAGSWGSALAFLAQKGGNEVFLWARDKKQVFSLTQRAENVKYLPGVSLASIEASADLGAVVTGAQWIVSAVPCAGLLELIPSVARFKDSDAVVVSGTKGLHPQNGARPSQLWQSLGNLDGAQFVALSGPNLAGEIVAGVPTSTVVASMSEETSRRAQLLFSAPNFRVYTNRDLIGVELGGALKNVVAITAGICDGLKFGDNAKAAIMTRHWREMTRLALSLGAKETTLFGLAGIGDLFATCASPKSRNHRLGEKLGRGETLLQAQTEVAQVAEGVHTAQAALALARQNRVELPVTEQLCAVLFQNLPVTAALSALMSRQGRGENEE